MYFERLLMGFDERVMKEIKISNDDHIGTYISFPSEMNRGELDELKEVVAIWIRQLERQCVAMESKSKQDGGTVL